MSLFKSDIIKHQVCSTQVLSTLKVGAEALKQNKVSLSEVDEIMDQLDEVLTLEFL